MSKFRRTLPTIATVFTFVLAGLLGWGLQTTSTAHADTVTTVTTTVVETVTSDPADRCEEDEPCWNPCTMGVNGNYPASDPLHWIAGPCDMSTQLPGGLRFQLSAEPVNVPGVDCAGSPFLQVTLMVVDPTVTGDIRAEEYAYGCARSGDTLGAFDQVLPQMYRDAAAQLDAV